MLISGSLITLLSCGIFVFFFFKGVPKLAKSPVWFIVVSIAVSMLVTGIWLVFYFWVKDQPDTVLFTATETQNYIIAIICFVLLILCAIYSKLWIIIIMTLIFSIAPLANRFIPGEINNDLYYITLSAAILLLITIGIVVYLLKKANKVK
jgi:hypothetical protein